MSYLSVSNFWKYQNADVWKKTKTHPPWFKHYVHRDRELDQLSDGARLLFWELLAAATRYSNVLEHDLNWICNETRVNPETVAEQLPLLIKGGWLSQTKSRKRSRGSSRLNREDPRDQEVEVEVETPSTHRKVSASTSRSEESGVAPPASPNGPAALIAWHDCPVEGCHRMTRTAQDLQIHIETDHEWNVAKPQGAAA